MLYSSHHAAINGDGRGRLRVEPKGAEFSRSVGCGLEDQYVGWLVRRFATRAKMQPTKNWRSSALPNACRTRSQAACRPAAIRGVQNRHQICQAAVSLTPSHSAFCHHCRLTISGFCLQNLKSGSITAWMRCNALTLGWDVFVWRSVSASDVVDTFVEETNVGCIYLNYRIPCIKADIRTLLINILWIKWY